MPTKRKKWILGVSFDDAKGHKRITKGENFLLMGGSRETHEDMREKVIKLNEQLKKKGKNLDEMNSKEFEATAHQVGLYPVKREPQRHH